MKGNSSKAKSKRSLGGFTLVELIVVIAVLAILAGVGAVAYNGYITYAQKGQDRQLVGEIMHALELADYSDPTLFGENGTTLVMITENGIKAPDSTAAALKDAFGDLSGYKLSYTGWKSMNSTKGIATALTALATLSGSLEASGKSLADIGYADVAADCWDKVQEAAEKLAETMKGMTPAGGSGGGGDDVGMDVLAVLEVAKRSTESSPVDWKSASFDGLSGGGTGAGGMMNMVSNKVARYHAFAVYLSKQPDFTGKDSIINQLETIFDEDGQLSENVTDFDLMTSSGSSKLPSGADTAKFNEYLSNYMGNQAEVDNKAYNTFMGAVWEQYKDSTTTDAGGNLRLKDDSLGLADTFFSEGRTLVDAAAQATRNKDLLNFLTKFNSEGSPFVSISASKVNGTLKFNVPDELNPRAESSSDSTTDEEPGDSSTCGQGAHSSGTVVVHFSGTAASVMNSSDTVTLCSIDGGFKSCTVTFDNGSAGNLLASCSNPTYSKSDIVEFNLSTGELKVVAENLDQTEEITVSVKRGSGKYASTYNFIVVVHGGNS